MGCEARNHIRYDLKIHHFADLQFYILSMFIISQFHLLSCMIKMCFKCTASEFTSTPSQIVTEETVHDHRQFEMK